jgi:transcriptional regulator with XRE-family HTH domain
MLGKRCICPSSGNRIELLLSNQKGGHEELSEKKNKNHNALAQYRRRLGFTQEQVEQLLGHRGRRAIWLFESGQSIPSLPTALKLAAIYRVPVEFLFNEIFLGYREEIRRREEAIHPVGQQTLFPILP